MAYNKELGSVGENMAARFLESKGYRIIENNFNCKLGEIDIICKDHNYLVFVEVKTRKSLKYGYPVEAISPRKVFSIIKTAQVYTAFKGIKNANIRFDVIEVILDNKEDRRINHIINAFQS